MDEKYWDFLDIFAQVPADYERAEDMLAGGIDINAYEEDRGKEAENLYLWFFMLICCKKP